MKNIGFYCLNFYRLKKNINEIKNYLINSPKFRGQPILKRNKFVFLASKRPNLATVEDSLATLSLKPDLKRFLARTLKIVRNDLKRPKNRPSGS